MSEGIMIPKVLISAALAVGTTLFVAGPTTAQGVDIEEVFNCAEDGPLGEQTQEQCVASREATLSNCTSCHTFVPIVKAQKSPEGWDATLEAHRTRVDMSDEAYAQLRDFLVAHFNPDNPPPELPPALESMGTNQAF